MVEYVKPAKVHHGVGKGHRADQAWGEHTAGVADHCNKVEI
jgi:hypothetical protein